MFKFHRIAWLAALVALAVVAAPDSALAQRRGNNNFGGNNNNNNNNNQSGNRGNRNRDNDNKDQSNTQQFQNLIQGGNQGGQGGQFNSGNSQQFRKSGNPQGGQQTFKNNEQFQQFIGGGQGQGNKNNNWQSPKYKNQNELQQWVVGFNGGPRPFSNDWYKNHPNAWHNNNNNDNWGIATAAGVVGWLGWQNVRPYNNTVYVYDPVPVQTVVVNGQPTVAIQPGNPGDWMTLGSYSLMTGAGDPGTRVLQLSVDKQGNIRGSYYDMITNVTKNVIGLIDKNTQQARWTLDSNQQLTFVATLDQLTQSQGTVNVKLPGGQVQQWQLVRMENAPTNSQQ